VMKKEEEDKDDRQNRLLMKMIESNQDSGSGFNIYKLANDPQWAPKVQDYISRQRQAENLDWIDRPDVSGVMSFSPLLFANAKKAVFKIQNSCPGLANVTLEDLIEIDETVRFVFANITAGYINVARICGPTRSQLDKNYARCMTEIDMMRSI
jgi:hypothetical protein